MEPQTNRIDGIIDEQNRWNHRQIEQMELQTSRIDGTKANIIDVIIDKQNRRNYRLIEQMKP